MWEEAEIPERTNQDTGGISDPGIDPKTVWGDSARVCRT